MTYLRYAVICRKNRNVVYFADKRCHAMSQALTLARSDGGAYWIAKIVAFTEVVIQTNVRRRRKQ